MNRLRLILICIGLSASVRGQEIGNYVSNGSFESLNSFSTSSLYTSVYAWHSLDTNAASYYLATTRPPFSNSPYAVGFQYARTGDNYVISQFLDYRGYPRNRLKRKLKANTTYCVRFYVVTTNNSPYALDAFGAYFGDMTLDTITKCNIPLTYLIPQIQNPTGNIITDTLNWTPITGTFVANGTEKYMVIGNFKSPAATNVLMINPTYLPAYTGDVCIDDVSVVELNLPAYAGRDTLIYSGDSTFIGRRPDYAIDSGCIWFKLPNITTAIDTISGLWVKPAVTSTYVVRQQLDCSPLKWDTVVVTIYTNPVGFDYLQWYSDNINLFPNPTADNLTISFSSSGSADIRKISIINSLGQTIREVDIEMKNNSFSLQTSDLDTGIYQIHFKTKAGTVTKQFVKN